MKNEMIHIFDKDYNLIEKIMLDALYTDKSKEKKNTLSYHMCIMSIYENKYYVRDSKLDEFQQRIKKIEYQQKVKEIERQQVTDEKKKETKKCHDTEISPYSFWAYLENNLV